MAQGKLYTMNQYDADKYCKDGGARLPTKEEFEQLAKYLGKGIVPRYSPDLSRRIIAQGYSPYGMAQGYSPYLADGKTGFLPGLSGYWFWASSEHPNDSDSAYYFHGYRGAVYYDYRDNSFYAVRCVSGR